MKKVVLLILLLISIQSYSQTDWDTRADMVLTLETVGFDIGGLNTETNIYVKLDFGLHNKQLKPAYFNIDSGYVITPNVYLGGIFGVYTPFDNTPFDKKTAIRLNYGGEIGYVINEKKEGLLSGYVISAFYTNNTYGIKVGFILNPKRTVD